MKNLFTLFIRRIVREKLISGIQIISLVLANTAGIIGLMYVVDELSYDRFHERKDRVYKVISDISDAKTGEIDSRLETVGWPLGKTLLDKFPEVEKVVYARSGAALQVNWEDERVQENVHYASKDFLSMFSFPIVSGNPETALEEP